MFNRNSTDEGSVATMFNNSNRAKHKKIRTPVGELTLIADDAHLLAVLWESDENSHRVKMDSGSHDNDHPLLLATEQQLNEYFSRRRKHFELPVKFSGTDFQKKVWNALLEIPYGETKTYLQIAAQLGDPNAARAVGLANGKNPVSIIAPCHRVVGANGKLTGFAGGLENKDFLLKLENPAKELTLF